MKIDGVCRFCGEPAAIVIKYTIRDPADGIGFTSRWLDHLLAPKYRACDEHVGTLVDWLRKRIAEDEDADP